jgi:hypothetical protein
MYHRKSAARVLTSSLLPMASRGAASFTHVQRQAMINKSDKLSSSRTFFSLPSFPPSTPSESEVHSVEDLSVKDRYSKKGDLLVYKETKRLPYVTCYTLEEF